MRLISYIKSNINKSAIEKDKIISSPLDELSNIKGNLNILNEIIENNTKIVGALRDFSNSRLKQKIAPDLQKLIQNSIIICRNGWKYYTSRGTDFNETGVIILSYPYVLGRIIINMIKNIIHLVKNKFKNEHFVKGKTLFDTSNHNKFFKIKISCNGIAM